ncbi:MAG: 2-succinyl-5-enolpyruvyl-6-hydroxy-3-cyclohexene-1-carboxylic-acid synthase [Crocinitomicaceae bacterium]|nr:2-succinyl-5-enolpyruvyl-6-hydroxy-3-cyclohexene-1-carboxylic-acid synthase [Crocinitomicaceae bacterium]
MKISNKIVVQNILSECIKNSISHVVFSPGSRNSPFAITFDAHPDITTHVIHDERVAGFFALGIAQTINKPVILCCTSGSALLNYFPAISEAFYREIPLIVISADRPKKLVNKGHGQTIMQSNVYGEHVKNSLSIEDLNPQDLITETALLFSNASSVPKGPAHLNVHLEEPLYEISNKSGFFENVILRNQTGKNPILSLEDLALFNDKKILVLCGQGPEDSRLKKALVGFNRNSNVIILNENTSGVNDQSFINCIDRILNGIDEKNEKRYTPDMIITIGGAIVSKRIKAFFIKNKPKKHFAIKHSVIGTDLFLRIDKHIKTEASLFFEMLNKKTTLLNSKNYKGIWQQLDTTIKDKIPIFFKDPSKQSDLEIFHALYQVLPENCTLHLGNSSVVRYMQLFDPVPNVKYECNRGTSGIDGSTSTAIGSAIAEPQKQHVFICGDVSFIYDSNAMWIRPFPENLKMIVIDNKGGGIFKIIEGAKSSPQLERYFEAKHQTHAEDVAKGFGIKIFTPEKKSRLQEQIISFFEHKEAQLLVLKTDSVENPKKLDAFFKHLRND